jgi:hypothetical protein
MNTHCTDRLIAYMTNKVKLLENNDNIYPRQSNNIEICDAEGKIHNF